MPRIAEDGIRIPEFPKKRQLILRIDDAIILRHNNRDRGIDPWKFGGDGSFGKPCNDLPESFRIASAKIPHHRPVTAAGFRLRIGGHRGRKPVSVGGFGIQPDLKQRGEQRRADEGSDYTACHRAACNRISATWKGTQQSQSGNNLRITRRKLESGDRSRRVGNEMHRAMGVRQDGIAIALDEAEILEQPCGFCCICRPGMVTGKRKREEALSRHGPDQSAPERYRRDNAVKQNRPDGFLGITIRPNGYGAVPNRHGRTCDAAFSRHDTSGHIGITRIGTPVSLSYICDFRVLNVRHRVLALVTSAEARRQERNGSRRTRRPAERTRGPAENILTEIKVTSISVHEEK